jgi:hypothetical protein
MNELPIISGAAYLERQYNITNEEVYSGEYEEDLDFLDEIVALEFCINEVRNKAGGYGHITDTLYPMRRLLIDKYEEATGLSYNYYNEEFI